ncbi:hypothetical protein F5884DRAFT_682626 [Xylogone sp. PMI_703]|nr:hypothetical protein F5884DRAFT_682626 [Xylogone sp. PMI_703]
MSVFSKIKLSRKAAKEHAAKKAERQNVEANAAPYKHVPTHAAVDALSGAPSSWKYDDRSKIRASNGKRREMRFNRTGSSLSTVSYATGYGSGMGPKAESGPNSQAPTLPRASSYSSYNAVWFDRGNEVYYLNNDQARGRAKPSRGHSYNDSGVGPSIGPSPLASNMQSEDVSPVESSGNSTNSRSSEHLEMSHPPPNPRRHSDRPQPTVYGEQDIFDRLHTSTTRKLGEAPLYDTAPEPVKPVSKTTVTTSAAKPKKQRWSLLGKKNTATIAV